MSGSGSDAPIEVRPKEQAQASYLKIKQSAMSCLNTLFRVSNKAFTLKGMWLLIFPSIATTTHGQQVTDKQVLDFISNEMQAEPTLLQLAFSADEE